jgi:hypothetical protein
MRTLPEHTFSSVEKQQALDLVLRSQVLARADQLRKFLRYICEMEDAGRAEEITEYSIGTEALGRPRDYSPAADSGVRGRAHDLRQKLEQFYEVENPQAKIRIGLRKGSYTPYFHEVSVLPAQTPPPFSALSEPAPLPISEPPASPSFLKRFGLNLLLLTIIAGLAARLLLLQPATRLDPLFHEFWGSFVQPGSDVLLCLATPPSLLIKSYQQPPRKNTFTLISPDNNPWYSRLHLPVPGALPYMYFSGDSPLFGDAEAAVLAAQVVAFAGGSVDFLPENTLRPAALRSRNVLVVGSPSYSTYAARILSNTPFGIHEDSRIGEEVIQERLPNGKSGQTFIPKRDEDRELVLVYGLITVFPNQSPSGRDSRTVIVSGVTGAGTSAAMHFFASQNGLRLFRERLRADHIASVPAAYQLVIKGSRDRAVPLNWELAAYRRLDHSPALE